MSMPSPSDSYRPTDAGFGGEPPRDGRSWSRLLRLVLLLLVLALLVRTWWGRRQPQAQFNPDAAPRAVTPRGNLAADEQSTIELFRAASPGVVYISSIELARNFRLDVLEIPRGTGTGFVWDRDGHVVTNAHVTVGGNHVRVTLGDQSVWRAAVVGLSASYDLAVLKIDAPASRLHPLPVGVSHDLQVGQKVFAIGNPFGLDHTLTTGVISGLGRDLQGETGRTIAGVIQTDAAINPGNSGGPLLDSSGRLIGVNTAIYSPTGASAGIGFAIPIDMVNSVVPELLRTGRVLRPGLGVEITSADAIARLEVEGALIISVLPDGAAAQAGLRPTRANARGSVEEIGDIITAINQAPVRNEKDLRRELQNLRVGDSVSLKVLRFVEGGAPRELEVQVTLQAIE